MSTTLIGLERAKLACFGATTSDDRTLDALIGAASSGIRRWCRRHLSVGVFDEILQGSPEGHLLLTEYPVLALTSVAGGPYSVVEVTNTSTTNQQARVRITAAGLELVRSASGVLARDSVLFASAATLTALVAAVNALGNGWSARIVGDRGGWPAEDLYIPPGTTLDCRGRWAGLMLYLEELADVTVDARGWLLRSAGWQGVWRVRYTAGYAEVPDAIQEACAGWVAELWQQTRRDPGLASLALVGSVSQTWLHPDGGPPARVRALLTPWRRLLP